MSILIKEPLGLFLHIPKTAGRSMRNWLKEYCGGFEPKHKVMHMDYNWNKKYIQKAYGINVDDGFTFTVVRNPWDRMVSAYHDFLDKNAYCTFEEFIKVKLDHTTFKKQMYHYVGSNTHVLYFENLMNDFEIVKNYFGVEYNMDHIGKTNHTHYSKYYNDELIELVHNRYADDIERFKYEFQKI